VEGILGRRQLICPKPMVFESVFSGQLSCRPTCASNDVQMVTVYSPLTWGIYTKPPPDIPECGYLGELCSLTIQGKSLLPDDR